MRLPDTFCICGVGPFEVESGGIFVDGEPVGDCSRCGEELPRTDPGREATVEYYRGLLREAEQQNEALRLGEVSLQEENRKLTDDLLRAEDALSTLLATTDLKAAPQTAKDKIHEVFRVRRERKESGETGEGRGR